MRHKHRDFYRRNLPHWQPPGAIFFVTFRTVGSLPNHAERSYNAMAEALRTERLRLDKGSSQYMMEWRRVFRFLSAELDTDCRRKGHVFNDSKAAEIMVAAILEGVNLRHYTLHASCVMPNHVHLLLEPLPLNLSDVATLPPPVWPPIYYSDYRFLLDAHLAINEKLQWRPLNAILGSMKGVVARRINALQKRHGELWVPESFDRWVRNEEEYRRTLQYIRLNPVKAGLGVVPEEWQWTG